MRGLIKVASWRVIVVCFVGIRAIQRRVTRLTNAPLVRSGVQFVANIQTADLSAMSHVRCACVLVRGYVLAS